jgi:hypothetical protein
VLAVKLPPAGSFQWNCAAKHSQQQLLQCDFSVVGVVLAAPDARGQEVGEMLKQGSLCLEPILDRCTAETAFRALRLPEKWK